MEEVYQSQDAFSELNTRLRDIEEKERLIKDRVLLLGKTLIEERDKTFKELQELKKIVIKIQEENTRMKEFIQRISEQLENTARKEELMILQRQFDLFKQ
ncbi:MAG: hypothetical protein WCK90_00650 [archaeon]